MDRRISDAQFLRHGDGGQGIEHIVLAGQIERDVQRLAPDPLHREARDHPLLAHVTATHIGGRLNAVSQQRSRDFGQHLGDHRIIGTQHR